MDCLGSHVTSLISIGTLLNQARQVMETRLEEVPSVMFYIGNLSIWKAGKG
jgi:hypothetical protein